MLLVQVTNAMLCCYIVLLNTKLVPKASTKNFECKQKKKQPKHYILWINFVVQVCNRLARHACDEYYEIERTVRKNRRRCNSK